MNEIKHTPGPWHYQEYSDVYTHLVRDASKRAIVLYAPQSSSPVSEANARLAAAAPDMAEVLEMLAAEADAGTIMIPSALRLSIDAALIKAGRKAAPQPVRHVTIAGGAL
ncbi:TPA: hypothetical protein ACKE3D_003947 [Burkholderia dolosa]